MFVCRSDHNINDIVSLRLNNLHNDPALRDTTFILHLGNAILSSVSVEGKYLFHSLPKNSNNGAV